MTKRLRLATFNLENLDFVHPDVIDKEPSLETRIAVLRPQFLRLQADIVCLQEVHGQEVANQPRQLLALQLLLAGTPYETYTISSTQTKSKHQVYDVRNLVVVSRPDITATAVKQYKHEFVPAPQYQLMTAHPPREDAETITWERPILHVTVTVPGLGEVHIINVHLKSKLPTPVEGQQVDRYTWHSISGWAEGFFVSSLKRVGQALETRRLIDTLFDNDAQAHIIACGDFNADLDDVPLEAIRGDVENTGNAQLAMRNMVPCERTVPEPARFTLYHQGRKNMLDHVLISRSLLPYYRSLEIHNEILHDESAAFASDLKYPESDHAPVVVEFELPDTI